MPFLVSLLCYAHLIGTNPGFDCTPIFSFALLYSLYSDTAFGITGI